MVGITLLQPVQIPAYPLQQGTLRTALETGDQLALAGGKTNGLQFLRRQAEEGHHTGIAIRDLPEMTGPYAWYAP